MPDIKGLWQTAGSWSSVSVTQPPLRPGRMAPHHAALVRQVRKDGKARIAKLNKEIKRAKAGARMNKRREQFHKAQMHAARRVARNQRKINAPLIKAQKAHLRSLRAEIRGHKQAIAKSKKQIKNARWNVKMMQRANSAGGKKRSAMRAYHQTKKSASWMWILHQAKKAMQRGSRARKPDGRNHGMTGVRKKGVTGLSGR